MSLFRIIRNLRFCEFDCNALATPEQQEIYLKYLGNSDGPYCPNDCQKLQLSLYKDYIVFLQYILGRVRKLKGDRRLKKGFCSVVMFCCLQLMLCIRVAAAKLQIMMRTAIGILIINTLANA